MVIKALFKTMTGILSIKLFCLANSTEESPMPGFKLHKVFMHG